MFFIHCCCCCCCCCCCHHLIDTVVRKRLKELITLTQTVRIIESTKCFNEKTLKKTFKHLKLKHFWSKNFVFHLFFYSTLVTSCFQLRHKFSLIQLIPLNFCQMLIFSSHSLSFLLLRFKTPQLKVDFWVLSIN